MVESAKLPRDILNVGRSIYVVGHIEHDDKQKGLIMFGEGRISSEDEQVIEFYSLDGNIWAPGSAGFDEQGNFSFVVGDYKSPTSKKIGGYSMQKTSLSKKDSGMKQPGILVEFVQEWMRTLWDLNFDEFSKKGPNTMSSTQPESIKNEFDSDPSTPRDSVATTHQELRASKAAHSWVVNLHMQGSPRKQILTRKKPMTVDCGVMSMGCPIQAEHTVPLDKCVNVGSNNLSSTLGGVADLAAKRLTTKKFVKPKHAQEIEFSRTSDLNNFHTLHKDFVTGFVKVKYFNKNIFSPDQMPAIDQPNQDPNEGSWFDWGKRAPPSNPHLCPKKMVKAISEHEVDMQLQCFDHSKQSNRINGQETNLAPFIDTPKQDLNGVSWYDWGKRAIQMDVNDILGEDLNGESGLHKTVPPSPLASPLASPPLSPNDTNNLDSCGNPSGNPSKVELNFKNSLQDNFIECKTSDQLIIKETPQHPSPQASPAEAHTTDKNTSPWTQLGLHSQPHEMRCDFHQAFPQISSPELLSPISCFQRPKPTLQQVVNPPSELAFGQIYRSITSPLSPNKANTAPWKPPGDPRPPLQQSLKFVFEERKVIPVGSPRQRASRLLCELRKQGYDQKKSTEAGATRKVGNIILGL
ncbi:unnamed protein product [Calypogeia fissa]